VFAALVSLAVGVSCRGFFVKPTLTALAVSPPTPTITNGTSNNTQQFTAVGTFDDGSHGSTPVTWTSGTQSVATISTNGLATAVGLGSSTITATSTLIPSITNTATLTVTVECIQSIAVTPTNPTQTHGNPQQFKATATTCNGTTDITDIATWTSSNTSIATIDSNGLATTIAIGTTNITATSGSVVSPAQVLTVN
jgi:hypothetical protein